MRVEGAFELSIPRAALYRRLLDPRLLAECIPGCEELERLDASRYRIGVSVGLGAVRAQFELVVEITREEPPHRILCVTRGEEGGRASLLSADSEILLTEVALDISRVQYISEVNLTGRLGKFALGVMKKKAQAMGDEFAATLREKLSTSHVEAERPVSP